VDDSAAARLAAAALTLAGIGLMCWAEMPPWQRDLCLRLARFRLRLIATRLAAVSGRRAMGRELAGAAEHDAGYERTFRLSVWRDRI
jgi:hypothetical protein